METAKKANEIVKSVVALLTNENDLNRFSPIPEIFNNAAGMVNGNAQNEAILKAYMVSQANNAVFLLWRRGILTDEIEKAYRELPTTEEATEDWNKFQDEDKKVADELEAKRRAYMEAQHEVDIFKAVLNGIPKEKAEEQYQKYQEQLSQAVAQQR